MGTKRPHSSIHTSLNKQIVVKFNPELCPDIPRLSATQFFAIFDLENMEEERHIEEAHLEILERVIESAEQIDGHDAPISAAIRSRDPNRSPSPPHRPARRRRLMMQGEHNEYDYNDIDITHGLVSEHEVDGTHMPDATSWFNSVHMDYMAPATDIILANNTNSIIDISASSHEASPLPMSPDASLEWTEAPMTHPNHSSPVTPNPATLHNILASVSKPEAPNRELINSMTGAKFPQSIPNVANLDLPFSNLRDLGLLKSSYPTSKSWKDHEWDPIIRRYIGPDVTTEAFMMALHTPQTLRADTMFSSDWVELTTRVLKFQRNVSVPAAVRQFWIIIHTFYDIFERYAQSASPKVACSSPALAIYAKAWNVDAWFKDPDTAWFVVIHKQMLANPILLDPRNRKTSFSILTAENTQNSSATSAPPSSSNISSLTSIPSLTVDFTYNRPTYGRRSAPANHRPSALGAVSSSIAPASAVTSQARVALPSSHVAASSTHTIPSRTYVAASPAPAITSLDYVPQPPPRPTPTRANTAALVDRRLSILQSSTHATPQASSVPSANTAPTNSTLGRATPPHSARPASHLATSTRIAHRNGLATPSPSVPPTCTGFPNHPTHASVPDHTTPFASRQMRTPIELMATTGELVRQAGSMADSHKALMAGKNRALDAFTAHHLANARRAEGLLIVELCRAIHDMQQDTRERKDSTAAAVISLAETTKTLHGQVEGSLGRYFDNDDNFDFGSLLESTSMVLSLPSMPPAPSLLPSLSTVNDGSNHAPSLIVGDDSPPPSPVQESAVEHTHS
ncbi:unnamed protein product [Rhizoctonia solani]|uniref:Uncharacterized protein n=1 Tax=Rhizoctonia solani TaxID=456999 RepID=A0A8H2Y137_9AGAM|nr:unnamed protein product [Rhizoctonia solani]